MNKEYYSVLFHYNPYTNKWNCFGRDCFNDYFNGVKKSRFGRGKNENEAFKDWKTKNKEWKDVKSVG